MKESDVKRRMVEVVKKFGGYAHRFEDQFSVGFPDCVFILPNYVPCFTEVKLFTGNVFDPSPRQYVELIRIQKSSTKVAAAVVGYKTTSGVFYISNPQKQVDIRNLRPEWCGEDFIDVLKEFLK